MVENLSLETSFTLRIGRNYVVSVRAPLSGRRRPTIYGDGEHTRDFTYVANVVDGVLRACTAGGASGEVINVATGGRISLNMLFTTIRSLVDAKVDPIYSAPRPGDVKDSQADIAKARLILGYEPTVAFEEGLSRTVAWYRNSHIPVA